ncbi:MULTISPECIES: VWA domain-containing protein [unclassified Halomonas]|uniref:vWA domain-containing protein n=1 Tax=unclassified Halomonas TaxID=2609666 RepID=UPI0020A11542|nr:MULTISPECIES: VWA domain-containing protein [unclassified Halomonas]MCP1313725.1 VWA domain-containing protein [Halomonas sp. 707D7]MCP1325807.1 VWA domain-containing protein [Halomonas sp. 707D4]
MFIGLFETLRRAGVPVSLRELLDLHALVERGVVFADMESFYHLARTVMVKDERYFDRFDRAFAAWSEGLESLEGAIEALIPDDWLRREFVNQLSEEEKAKIDSLGGLEALIETFKQRLAEQKERHAGGSKWIGTGGTSPFGAYGYNPEGMRIGQEGSRHRRAVKVWDERRFRDYDDSLELGTRNLKMALRRLRKFARQGARSEFDVDATIRETARDAGLLNVQMRPERHNAVKVLLFLDVGGSMDDHVRLCEELFSAARSEFKHLDYVYFHNCLYESVWKSNRRRQSDRLPTEELLRTYGPDYQVIVVGDAAMSPYEITHPGGSVEHVNEESGGVWLERLTRRFPKLVWLNPTPANTWHYTYSTGLVREIVGERMYPLSVEGLERAMRELAR